MYFGLHVKCPLFMSDFDEDLSTDFREILKYKKFNEKSIQWDPNCCLCTDGQTDMKNLIFAYRNLAKAPTNISCKPHVVYLSLSPPVSAALTFLVLRPFAPIFGGPIGLRWS